jgi:hypothetical protein
MLWFLSLGNSPVHGYRSVLWNLTMIFNDMTIPWFTVKCDMFWGHI